MAKQNNVAFSGTITSVVKCVDCATPLLKFSVSFDADSALQIARNVLSPNSYHLSDARCDSCEKVQRDADQKRWAEQREAEKAAKALVEASA